MGDFDGTASLAGSSQYPGGSPGSARVGDKKFECVLGATVSEKRRGDWKKRVQDVYDQMKNDADLLETFESIIWKRSTHNVKRRSPCLAASF